MAYGLNSLDFNGFQHKIAQHDADFLDFDTASRRYFNKLALSKFSNCRTPRRCSVDMP